MGQYLPILALLVLAVVFGAVSRVVSKLLAPRNPTAAKLSPYECGITSSTEPPERFPVTFFLVAMIFIVFDIEIVFLYPLAVQLHALGWFGFVEFLFFIVILAIAYVYIWRKGALEW
jgi:NADH-quinone oxidoreductase subunit A